jgi:hypothetical protein
MEAMTLRDASVFSEQKKNQGHYLRVGMKMMQMDF